MVTCVANPQTRHRRGSSGFRSITIALFCAGLATFTALTPIDDRHSVPPVLSAHNVLRVGDGGV
jgi:hypothetical protein